MKKFIQNLPPAAEFWIVIVIAFGVSFGKNLYLFLYPEPTAIYTEARMVRAMIAEPILFTIIGWFLLQRGWTLNKISNIRPTLSDFTRGLQLMLMVYGGALVIGILWKLAGGSMAHPVLIEPGISILTILIMCPLNALFEEILVCGYIVTFFRKYRTWWLGIAVSAAIMMSYHLAQGLRGILLVAVVRIVLGIWYQRTNRLWPAVVAHCFIDLINMILVSQVMNGGGAA
jgi:membrane protease YdiL (CAAX protease family)